MINSEIETYAKHHSSEESDDAKQLVKHSEEQLRYTDMLSGRVVGGLLAMFVKVVGAKRILEVGTFTGYASLRMAEALPEDGTLITCDYNERYKAIAREALQKSAHGYKITQKMGPALETLPTLEPPFDMIFLDADKIHYPDYYELLLPMLGHGGLMVIDNVLWSGQVLKPDDRKARAIDRLNTIILKDERVEQVMLTVRDGVTIVRKKGQDL